MANIERKPMSLPPQVEKKRGAAVFMEGFKDFTKELRDSFGNNQVKANPINQPQQASMGITTGTVDTAIDAMKEIDEPLWPEDEEPEIAKKYIDQPEQKVKANPMNKPLQVKGQVKVPLQSDDAQAITVATMAKVKVARQVKLEMKPKKETKKTKEPKKTEAAE